MPVYTTDQVTAMAPDAASVKAGRGLANLGKWQGLQCSEQAAWGECQGSGKDPYRSSVDFSGPAFKCTCPSRKFPCKHGLGLMYLLAEKSTSFAVAEPPEWVRERLQKRQEAAEKKLVNADSEKSDTPEEKEKKEKARAKRQASREQNVEAALDELDLWLQDMVRQGLAGAREQPVRSYESVAARMVDQQATGLSRMVQHCRHITARGGNWTEDLFGHLGRMRLLSAGYRRCSELAPGEKADLRGAVGWQVTEAEVLEQGKNLKDCWQVAGQRVDEEERLKVQRTWLVGAKEGKPALILQFAAGMQPLDISLVPGRVFEGELTFFPSANPLRAVVKSRNGDAIMEGKIHGGSVDAAMDAVAARWAGNPWTETLPLSLDPCFIVRKGEAWWVRDVEGKCLPLHLSFFDPWILLALDGGHGLSLFGEWDGCAFLPLSAWADGRFINLNARLVSP